MPALRLAFFTSRHYTGQMNQLPEHFRQADQRIAEQAKADIAEKESYYVRHLNRAALTNGGHNVTITQEMHDAEMAKLEELTGSPMPERCARDACPTHQAYGHFNAGHSSADCDDRCADDSLSALSNVELDTLYRRAGMMPAWQAKAIVREIDRRLRNLRFDCARCGRPKSQCGGLLVCDPPVHHPYGPPER
jgi:hypothetical protein